MSALILGMIGAIVILFAWAVEAEESIRRHKCLIDLKFAAMYAIATTLMVMYSYDRNDAVFLWFQSGLLCIILFEIGYTILVKKVHRS